MKRMKWMLLWALAAGLCLLAACQPEVSVPETPSDGPSEVPSQTVSQPPESTAPAESESPAPSESQPQSPVLTVSGEELAATEYESPVGYTVLCPEEQIAVNAWEGGETFDVSGAEGTYLSICRLDAPSISTAVIALQFEYAIEEEPRGCLIGAKGYAGVRMTTELEDLRIEYILCEEQGSVYLLELALYGEGTAQEELLRAMLDTFELNS